MPLLGLLELDVQDMRSSLCSVGSLMMQKRSHSLTDGGYNRNDDKTAEEYKLEGGATLHLVLALRGGSC